MIPQILKSDKFAFQEKEYLTIACMKEQISANSKTVQEGRVEKSSQDLPRFIFTGSNILGRNKQKKASTGSMYSLQKVSLYWAYAPVKLPQDF